MLIEVGLRNLIAHAETRMYGDQSARLEGTRRNSCFGISGEIAGLANQYGFSARVVLIDDINRLRGGNVIENHNIVVIERDGRKWLGDPSICQFLNGGKISISGARRENPLLTQLLQDGFIPLTDENLHAYLDLLTPGDDHGTRILGVVTKLDLIPSYYLGTN